MRYNFNGGWSFAKLKDSDNGSWESVTLPHTWNRDDCAAGASQRIRSCL